MASRKAKQRRHKGTPWPDGYGQGKIEAERRYLKGRRVYSLEEQRGMACPLPPETEGTMDKCPHCGAIARDGGLHPHHPECPVVMEMVERARKERGVNQDYTQQLIEQRDAALDALGKAEERAAALEAVAEAVRDWIANGGRESITYSQRLREHYDHLLGTGWLPRAEREEP